MVQVFHSVHHPGAAPPPLVYARALIRPLGACMLPVMIVATVLVLSRVDALIFVAWASPAAYLVASGWTAYNLGRTPAEMVVTEDSAALRSIWQVARGKESDTGGQVFWFRDDGTVLNVSIGRVVVSLHPDEWPEGDVLANALDRAALAVRVQSRR